MRLTLGIFMVLLIAACQPRSYQQLKQTSAAVEKFGDEVKDKKLVTLSDLERQLSYVDTVHITTMGEINSVCQKKGCWMTVSPSADSSPSFMVKFKDYGFFVPKDVSGETVVMHGKAYRQVTSVNALRHYAEDAGKSQREIDAITQPKEELIFIADGVEIFREKI